MSRRKRERFAAITASHNVLEPGKEIYEKIKGRWHLDYFRNSNPITVEVGCGRGEYTIGLSRLFPECNFIGVDIKGDRIWKGSSLAQEEDLCNVAFLRTQIDLLENFFKPGEIDEIWITFPDPRPKERDEKRRVVHPRFLEIYRSLMAKNGYVRLKTDNTPLFEYALEVIQQRNDVKDLKFTFDLYHHELKPECHDIRTKYEQKFNEQGHDIKYLRFRFF